MAKEVLLSERKSEFYMKFFSEDAKQIFLEQVRKVNKPGGFVRVIFTEKYDDARQVKYFSVEKLSYENSTLEHLTQKCKLADLTDTLQNENDEFWEKLMITCQEMEGAYFAWKERDCINATLVKARKVETA